MKHEKLLQTIKKIKQENIEINIHTIIENYPIDYPIECSDIDTNTLNKLKTQSKNDIEYYFTLFRILTINLHNSKQQFEHNNSMLKKDSMNFIEKNNIKYKIKNPQSQPPINKTTKDTQKNTKTKTSKKESPKKSKKESPKKDTHKKETKENPTKPPNIEDTELTISPKSINSYFKKLYLIISKYTHPDKTKKKLFHYLSELSLEKLKEEEYYYLILIFYILDLKRYTRLCTIKQKEKNLLNSFINNLIHTKNKYIQSPVYNYKEYNDFKKKQCMCMCLNKGRFNFSV